MFDLFYSYGFINRLSLFCICAIYILFLLFSFCLYLFIFCKHNAKNGHSIYLHNTKAFKAVGLFCIIEQFNSSKATIAVIVIEDKFVDSNM